MAKPVKAGVRDVLLLDASSAARSAGCSALGRGKGLLSISHVTLPAKGQAQSSSVQDPCVGVRSGQAQRQPGARLAKRSDRQAPTPVRPDKRGTDPLANAKSISGSRPLTMRAMLLPDSQKWVHPSAP